MSRTAAAFTVVILISTLTLLWVAEPVIQAHVPIWIIIDALVAQIVISAGLSGQAGCHLNLTSRTHKM